nr:MAG TPA: hypothetical protein [Caudoviricetes sp.]
MLSFHMIAYAFFSFYIIVNNIILSHILSYKLI